MNQPVVVGRNISKSFGKNTVLVDVNIEVFPGEIVALMGPSGSGKSTLMHLLAGLLPPDNGTVELGGILLGPLSEARRSRLRLTKMGFVFQFGDLVPELTLGENVQLPLRAAGKGKRYARTMSHQTMEALGIGHLAHKRTSEVSGGEAQRAAVARALVHQPAVVFADEPTGSLDTLAGELVLEQLTNAARERGAAVLLVTHEAKVAAWADREITLLDGKVLQAGSPRHAAATQ